MDEDGYVSHIWMQYMDIFRNPNDDIKLYYYRMIEQRLQNCLQHLHPDYAFQNAANGLLQLSMNLQTLNQNFLEEEQEEEEEPVPLNVIDEDEDTEDLEDQNIQYQNLYNWDTDVLSIVLGPDEASDLIDQLLERSRFELFTGNINDLPEAVECPICFENVELSNVAHLQCNINHRYCSDCMLHICDNANPRCSLCREEIREITVYSDDTFESVAPYLI